MELILAEPHRLVVMPLLAFTVSALGRMAVLQGREKKVGGEEWRDGVGEKSGPVQMRTKVKEGERVASHSPFVAKEVMPEL